MANPQKISDVGIRQFGESIGVFNRASRQSHMLNTTASFVWQKCDGNTSPADLVALLKTQFNLPQVQAHQLLWLTLNDLASKNLLVSETLDSAPSLAYCDRREVLKGLTAVGLAVALLPTVAALPAQAQNYIPPQVVVTGYNGGVGNGTYTYSNTMPNGRPSYVMGGFTIQWTGSQWEFYDGSVLYIANTANTFLPPHTGWSSSSPDGPPPFGPDDLYVAYTIPAVGGVAQTMTQTASTTAIPSRVAAFVGGVSAIAGSLWLMTNREQTTE